MIKSWEEFRLPVYTTLIDEKGRVLLPSKVRKSLSLKKGY
jgi:bifunctional DNA-binding transcriptional regulator/antitoxin component of YhaV-PrlF toxin-antitoxin module